MRLYTSQNAPVGPAGERIYGQSRLQKFLGFAVAAVVAAGLFWAAMEGGYQSGRLQLPPWLLFWMSGVVGFLAILLLLYAWASLRKSNWVLRASPEYILVNLRSHLNRHLAAEDPTILQLVFSEIEGIRRIREEVSAPHLGDDPQESVFGRTCLDVQLADGVDVAAIREAFRSEISRVEQSHRKHLHYPAQVLDAGIIRIGWDGVRPGIRSVLKDLGQKLPVLPEKKISAENWRALAGKAVEQSIRNLVLQGHRTEAVALAQRKYELDLTDATQLVNALFTDQEERKRR